jgi:hypothetical protein
MKYRIWGSVSHSPIAISYALAKLRVSHTLVSGKRTLVVDKKREQPVPVHVTPHLKDYRKGTVNFIVASAAELATTNYPLLSTLHTDSLIDEVREALLKRVEIVPAVTEMLPIDYVNQVAKPSLLNKIQTQIYKIQPYSLRKTTQHLVLGYLKSEISESKIRKALADNLKHEELLPLVLAARPLREAVARLAQEPLEKVAAESGYPTFELLYISKERK